MKSPPKVMVVNARSVYTKLNELEILVDNNNSDLVFLTKTWLTDNIPDEAINCLDMNLVSVYLPVKYSTNKGKTVKVKVREIKQTNANRFGFFLENFDSNQVLGEEGVDKKVQTFLECSNSMINLFFPEKT